jgi:hypothetical protein
LDGARLTLFYPSIPPLVEEVTFPAGSKVNLIKLSAAVVFVPLSLIFVLLPLLFTCSAIWRTTV